MLRKDAPAGSGAVPPPEEVKLYAQSTAWRMGLRLRVEGWWPPWDSVFKTESHGAFFVTASDHRPAVAYLSNRYMTNPWIKDGL